MPGANPFIPIASPKLRPAPPTGPNGCHEVKFDGSGSNYISAIGKCASSRATARTSPTAIPAAVLSLPVKSVAIGGELVGCDGEDRPDFYDLMRRPASGLCLVLRSVDVEARPTAQLSAPGEDARRQLAAVSHLHDGEKLLHAAAQNGLEGIVSKKRLAPYVGRERLWLDQGEDGGVAARE
jgi:bifunctional non-homologous end joining protein LigD